MDSKKLKEINLFLAVKNFLNDSSWTQYKGRVSAIEMRIRDPEYRDCGIVQCGIVPFMELEKAYNDANTD